jgi:hypothetical protein
VSVPGSQVGFLRLLAREFADVVPGILTGCPQAGSTPRTLPPGRSRFRIDDVFRLDLRNLASRSVRWGGRLLSGGKYPLPPARSLVDTAPLRSLLRRLLQTEDTAIAGIFWNLQAGWLRAIALTASSYT